MIVAKSLAEFQAAYEALPNKSDIGFVPTMGALHEGHLSLIRRSVEENTSTIISIFVNPTQFNNPNDLATYPRTLEADCALVEPVGVDIVFAPQVHDIYPEPDQRIFNLGGLDRFGEGPRRPGHFNGVAQVVTRLFDLVRPSRSYFGEKDFQQLAILRFVTEDLQLPVEIIGCPIARAEDGLALSSRNTLLTPSQREAAPHIYRCICQARTWMHECTPAETIQRITDAIHTNPELETEYIEIFNARTLEPVENWDDAAEIQLGCAIFAHPVRLIDNIKLK